MTGERELPDEFGGIAGGVKLASGAIVIADNGRSLLRVFPASDGSGHSLGRPGNGPGEFKNLYRLHACDDYLVAYDFNQSRLQIFSETKFVRQVQLPTTLTGADFVGCSGLDSLAFVQMPAQIPGRGTQVFPLTILRFDTESREIEWLTTLRGTEMFVSSRYQSIYERPFGLRSLVAAGVGGIFIAETHEPTVQKLAADQARVSLTMQRLQKRSVKAIDRKNYFAERVAEEPDSTARKAIRSVLDEAEWGDSLPIMDRLMTTVRGDIFLRLAPASTDTVATWLMMRFDSPKSNKLQVPRAYRLLYIDDASILAVKLRESGEEIVSVLSYK